MAPGGRCRRCNQDIRGFGERATSPAPSGRRLVSRRTSGSKPLSSQAGQECRYDDKRVPLPRLKSSRVKTGDRAKPEATEGGNSGSGQRLSRRLVDAADPMPLQRKCGKRFASSVKTPLLQKSVARKRLGIKVELSAKGDKREFLRKIGKVDCAEIPVRC